MHARLRLHRAPHHEPVTLRYRGVRNRRTIEQLPPACDDTCPMPGHVTSSLLAEVMRYGGEGLAILPEHAKKTRIRET